MSIKWLSISGQIKRRRVKMHESKTIEQIDLVPMLLSFIVTMLLIGSTCLLLNSYYKTYPNLDQTSYSVFVYKLLIKYFYTHTIFLTNLFLLPAFSFFAIKLASLLRVQYSNPSLIFCINLFLISAGTIFILYCGIPVLKTIAPSIMDNILLLSLAAILSAASILYLVLTAPNSHYLAVSKYALFISTFFFFVFVMMSFRILSFYQIFPDRVWWVDFNAVFYSVSQVAAGKTLLVDLPAQYGFYAEFLNPFFKLFGLSVLSFTILMGILQTIGTLSITYVLCNITRPLIAFFALISIIYISAEIWYFICVGWDPFYQYWPIRFFFPATAIALFYFYLLKPTLLKLSILAAFSSIAILWNIDSGVPTFVSLLCYFGLDLIFSVKNSRKQILLNISVILTILLLIFLMFHFYIYLKAGTFPTWSLSLQYQNFFYNNGGLGQTIHWDYWLLLPLIYVIALLIGFYKKINDKDNLRSNILLYLSFLGLGLFTYFENNTHIYVYCIVSWPAFIVIFILIDAIYQELRRKQLSYFYSLLTLPFIFYAFISLFSISIGLPKLYHYYKYNTSIIKSKPKTEFVENLEFIKNNIKWHDNIALLVPNQGAYYAELGIASSINGPGSTETLLQKDVDYTITQLDQSPIGAIVFTQNFVSNIPTKLTLYYQYLVSNKKYKIVKQNEYGIILMVKVK